MEGCRSKHWSRREFLGGLTLVGTAGLIALKPESTSAEPPPETTAIRLIYDPDYSARRVGGSSGDHWPLLRAPGSSSVWYGQHTRHPYQTSANGS